MSKPTTNPTAGIWATVVVVLLLGYPLSFGPACWIGERTGVGAQVISIAYRPIIRLADKNQQAQRIAFWYASLGVTSGKSPVIVNNEIHWNRRYADFSALFDLIQSTFKPGTGYLIAAPIDDPDADTEREQIE